jgi:hypothetical protein
LLTPARDIAFSFFLLNCDIYRSKMVLKWQFSFIDFKVPLMIFFKKGIRNILWNKMFFRKCAKK